MGISTRPCMIVNITVSRSVVRLDSGDWNYLFVLLLYVPSQQLWS